MALLPLAVALVAAVVVIAGGYAVWLLRAPEASECGAARRRFQSGGYRRRTPKPLATYPEVLIVVPVFDEAALIGGKLTNIAALTYPSARVVIVDGGSSDGTIEIIERSGVELLRTQLRDKTAQIGAALRLHGGAEWIVVTDADAVLAPDSIERLMAVAMDDDSVGVVGARVRPRGAHALESLHWRFADWLRERECDRGSAAIVTAPCYLARRELIANMPADTLADDVHVACRALAARRRVGRGDTIVHELRSPRSIAALLRHKFRKADAYLREVFRFLPSIGAMRAPARTIFLWRAALLTIVPLLAAPLLPAAALAAAAAMSVAPRRGRAAARLALLAVLLIAVAAAALLRYPFSRQTASFPKIALFDEAE